MVPLRPHVGDRLRLMLKPLCSVAITLHLFSLFAAHAYDDSQGQASAAQAAPEPTVSGQGQPAESLSDDSQRRTEVIDHREGQDGVASSTTVDRSQMDDAASDLPEVLDRQPGVVVSRTGGLGSFASVSIRGSTPEQVLLLLDDIPLVSAEGSPVDLSMLPLGVMGRIVVTRGSSPAAFGVSAIGGVIQAKTRSVNGPLLEVEGSTGSYMTRGVRLIGGYGDESGDLSVLAAVSYLGSEGAFPYRSDGGTAFDATDDRTISRDNNHFDRLVGLLNVQVQPSPGVTLTLTELVTSRRRGLPWVGLYQTRETQLDSLQNILGASLRVDLPGARGRRLVLAPWLSLSETRIADPLNEFAGRLDASEDHSLMHGYRLSLRYPVAIQALPGLSLTPLTTAVYRHERFVGKDQRGDSRTRTVRGRHRFAAVGELTLDYEPAQVALVVSGRYEGVIDESDTERPDPTHIGSFRVGLVYRPIPQLILRTNVARGARFPTLFERFGDSAYVLGRAELKPELGTTVDVGVRFDAHGLDLGEYLWVEALGFTTWVDDLIHYAQNSQGVSRPDNTERALLAGVELGLVADVLRHLRVQSNLTWMVTENRGPIVARQGQTLPYRPTWRSYTRLEAYGDVGEGQELGGAVDITYSSGHALDHANLSMVPERLVLGAGAWVELLDSQLRIAVNLRNMTDLQLVDFSGYPMPGLTAMVSVTGRPSLD